MGKILILGSSGRIGTVLAAELKNIMRLDVAGVYDHFVDANNVSSVRQALWRAGQVSAFINCTYPDKNTHLASYIDTTIAVADHMVITQSKGSIILFSSVYGSIIPRPSLYEGTDLNCPIWYHVAKAGIIALAKAIAVNYGIFGIRVNAISPGGIQTDDHPKSFVTRYSERTPLGRMARPQDLIGIVKLLCSTEGSYISGANIVVDGGYSC